MESDVGYSMKPDKSEILRTAPISKEEAQKQDDAGLNAIAAGAATGGIFGSIFPLLGTAVGSTIGAGVGFIAAIVSREVDDSKRPQYQALKCQDDE